MRFFWIARYKSNNNDNIEQQVKYQRNKIQQIKVLNDQGEDETTWIMKFGLFIAAACVVSVGPDVVVIASAMGLPELVFLLLVLSVAAAMVWVASQSGCSEGGSRGEMGNFMVCLGLLFVAYMADVADCFMACLGGIDAFMVTVQWLDRLIVRNNRNQILILKLTRDNNELKRTIIR